MQSVHPLQDKCTQMPFTMGSRDALYEPKKQGGTTSRQFSLSLAHVHTNEGANRTMGDNAWCVEATFGPPGTQTPGVWK